MILEQWLRQEPVVVALHPNVERHGIADLRLYLHDVVAAGAREIIVDASDVDLLPSRVIGALLTAHRACRRRGGHVELRNLSRRTLDQLQRTGLRHVFHVELDKPAARHGSLLRQGQRKDRPT